MTNPFEFYDHKIKTETTDSEYIISVCFRKNQTFRSRVHKITEITHQLDSVAIDLKTHPEFKHSLSRELIHKLYQSKQLTEIDFVFLKQIYMALNGLVEAASKSKIPSGESL